MAMGINMNLEQKKWYDLLAKLVNEQGGWKIGADTYDVEMIIYDSAGDAVKGKDLLNKLIFQDGVKFIFGSPTGNAATDAEDTEPNKVICLSGDWGNASADPKIQYYFTPMGGFFSSGLLYDLYKDMEAKDIKSYAALKSDDMIGHMADGWNNKTWAVAAPDVKYVGTVFYDPSTSDFGPIATKIKSLNPDVVDCTYALTTLIYNSLYDVGWKGSILPQLMPDQYEAVLTHCGKAFMEGWESPLQDPRGFQKDPAMLALIDAYIKEYGTFQSGGCVGTCFWFVLKDAIDNTQSVDVDVIKAYLDNQPYPVSTLTGYCQLFARPDVSNLRTITGVVEGYLGTVKDGVLAASKVAVLKDQYLATILCNNLVDVYKAYWEQYGYPEFPADETSTVNFSDLGITGHD
jgi:ABC-type branched-subunit amino acid transport system substrate-binding protein